MADWQNRARISGDVVFFEYVTSKLERNSDSVFVWDIDKTYLDTHFETLKELFRTAFEKAFQKKNIPGTSALVRALTTSLDDSTTKPFPIYFISASPPQMERKIRAKLDIDGINPYGAFFKDNLKNLKPKYFKRLSQQVGYKLQALLELRTRLKEDVKQTLFGDDSESDALVYSLYSDICNHRLDSRELERVLDQSHVTQTQMAAIFELQERIPKNDPVEKIYINLANDTDPDYYEKFGRRTFPTFNTFQMALDLFQDTRLLAEQLLRVVQDMITNYGFTPDEISKSLDDLIARKRVTLETTAKVVELLKTSKLLPVYYQPSGKPQETIEMVRKAKPWILEHIDYLNDFR